jgi:hypothetical protein
MPEITETSLSNLKNDEIAAHLPPEVLQFLVRSVPSRPLWKWLGGEEQTALLHDLTRGFQRTANALRQPIVRNRLSDHLRHDNKTFQALLAQWGQSSPPPPIVSETQSLSDDELNAQLPSLLQRHGPEALLLSLLLNERRAALDTWETLDESTLEITVNTDTAPDHDAISEASTADGMSSHPSTRDEAETQAKMQDQRDAAEQALQKERGEKHRWRDAAHTAQKELKAVQAQLQNETRTLSCAPKQESRAPRLGCTQRRKLKSGSTREARALSKARPHLKSCKQQNTRFDAAVAPGAAIHEDLRKQHASQTIKLRRPRKNFSLPRPQRRAQTATNKHRQHHSTGD